MMILSEPRLVFASLSTLSLLLFSPLSSNVVEGAGYMYKKALRTVTIEGKASHGVNYFNGEQVTDWAEILDFLSQDESCVDTSEFWANIVIPESAYYVPNSDEAGLVTADTPLDSLLATKTGGFDNSGEENDLMHDNFFMANINQTRRQIIKSAPGQTHYEITRRDIPDITVGEYNSVRGEATFTCYDDGTSSVHIEYENLPPLYPLTVWNIGMCTTQGCLDEDSTVQTFGGIPMYIPPLGPLPNGFYSDKNGNGVFETELPYCLLEMSEDPTMFLSTAMHWDGGMYGAFFDTFRTDTYGAGVISSPICTFYTGDNLFYEKLAYPSDTTTTTSTTRTTTTSKKAKNMSGSGEPVDKITCAYKPSS